MENHDNESNRMASASPPVADDASKAGSTSLSRLGDDDDVADASITIPPLVATIMPPTSASTTITTTTSSIASSTSANMVGKSSKTVSRRRTAASYSRFQSRKRLVPSSATDADEGPPSRIASPNPGDVLLGRGKPYQSHSGNIRMHQLVDQFRPQYKDAPRNDKPVIAQAVVNLIKSESNARFLRRAEDGSELWEEVNDDVSREKISHAFRNKARRTDRNDMPPVVRPTNSRSFPFSIQETASQASKAEEEQPDNSTRLERYYASISSPPAQGGGGSNKASSLFAENRAFEQLMSTSATAQLSSASLPAGSTATIGSTSSNNAQLEALLAAGACPSNTSALMYQVNRQGGGSSSPPHKFHDQQQHQSNTAVARLHPYKKAKSPPRTTTPPRDTNEERNKALRRLNYEMASRTGVTAITSSGKGSPTRMTLPRKDGTQQQQQQQQQLEERRQEILRHLQLFSTQPSAASPSPSQPSSGTMFNEPSLIGVYNSHLGGDAGHTMTNATANLLEGTGLSFADLTALTSSNPTISNIQQERGLSQTERAFHILNNNNNNNSQQVSNNHVSSLLSARRSGIVEMNNFPRLADPTTMAAATATMGSNLSQALQWQQLRLQHQHDRASRIIEPEMLFQKRRQQQQQLMELQAMLQAQQQQQSLQQPSSNNNLLDLALLQAMEERELLQRRGQQNQQQYLSHLLFQQQQQSAHQTMKRKREEEQAELQQLDERRQLLALEREQAIRQLREQLGLPGMEGVSSPASTIKKKAQR